MSLVGLCSSDSFWSPPSSGAHRLPASDQPLHTCTDSLRPPGLGQARDKSRHKTEHSAIRIEIGTSTPHSCALQNTMATNGNFNHQEQYPAAPASEAPSATAAESTHASPNPSKDEVGWYFVEQYYTTLSKNPSKLHVRSPKNMPKPWLPPNTRIS